jgi:hypothetical protein
MSSNFYLTIAVQMFQRSNPISQVTAAFHQVLYFLSTYRSNVKLNKFRHSLYVQQMQRMEGYLQDTPQQYQGHKMDRKF